MMSVPQRSIMSRTRWDRAVKSWRSMGWKIRERVCCGVSPVKIGTWYSSALQSGNSYLENVERWRDVKVDLWRVRPEKRWFGDRYLFCWC